VSRGNPVKEQEPDDERISEAIVLVESIPCPMHLDGGSAEISPQIVKDEQKRVKLVSKSGREIVGPGYSRPPEIEKLAQGAGWTRQHMGRRIGDTWRAAHPVEATRTQGRGILKILGKETVHRSRLGEGVEGEATGEET
jgi:hypothetical protein